MKNFTVFLLLISSHILFAQKESNYWVFGCGKAITFNSGKPVSKNTPMPADPYHSGASTICNSKGKLLFYVIDGGFLDSTHRVMPNGTFKNVYNNIQSGLIVPWPDSSHLYYVFTPGVGPKDSLKYSIVNMKLRGGLGDVVNGQKERRLPNITSGKVTAVKHLNKKDYWLITPQGDSDTIIAYLITSKGIVSPSVKSKTGIYISGGPAYPNSSNQDDFYAYLKISPNGKKLCNINRNKSSMIADFDVGTGKISNIWDFPANGFGLEFSPKSKYLYTGVYTNGKNGNHLVQYDLSLKTRTAFLASKKNIDSLNFSAEMQYPRADMQLALDGKIYLYNGNGSYLYVIHSADSSGKDARLERNFLQYSMSVNESRGHMGLPFFVQSLFHKPTFEIKQNCARDTAYFKIIESYNLDSAQWDFGDPSSGALNTSKDTSHVFHSYKNSGTYKVRLIAFYPSYSDTIYESFFVNYPKPYLGDDILLCKSNYVHLNPKGNFVSYKWNNGLTTPGRFVSAGTYRLTATDYDGCISSDTIVVKEVTVKADFNIFHTGECFRDNKFSFNETAKFTNDKHFKSTWYFSDSTSISDTSAFKTFAYPRVYEIKLVSESQAGCSDSVTKKITVFPQTKVDFAINKATQCLNKNTFNFLNTSKDTGAISYAWTMDGQFLSNAKSIADLKFIKEGSYKVSLKSTTDKNCLDSISKLVTVLPSPKADFDWGLACSRTKTNFTFTGTKPDLPVTTLFEWRFSDEGKSTLENPSYIFNTSGNKTINLLVTTSNGCFDTLKKTIEIKSHSKADFSAADICETDSAVFVNKSQDATSYIWKFGDGNTSKIPNPKHWYDVSTATTFNITLVAVVADGCSDSIIKALTVNESPGSDFTFTSKNGKVDFIASETKAFNYRWQFGNGDSAKVSIPNYSYSYSKYPAQYTVCLKVSNAAACQTETCKEVNVAAGISYISKPTGFKIYPNPNTGSFTIEIDNPSKDVSIEVYDMLGKIVKTIETVPNKTSYPVDLSVADGMYLLRIINDGIVWNMKVSISN